MQTTKEIQENYKHVYFRLYQTIYVWGKGWTVSNRAIDEWKAEISVLIMLLGLLIPKQRVVASSPEGVNNLGESIYLHPMDFTGYIHKDNIQKFEKVIREFKSQYWSFKNTDVYELSDKKNEYGNVYNIEENKNRYLVVSN